MANGKLGVEQKLLHLDTIKDAATLYLGFLGTVVDFTEDNYAALDVEVDELALTSVAAKFNGAATNPSGSLCSIANDSVILTGNAAAGSVELTGWFLSTTDVPSTATIVALQNFVTPITTVVGVPLAFAIGDLTIQID